MKMFLLVLLIHLVVVSHQVLGNIKHLLLPHIILTLHLIKENFFGAKVFLEIVTS